jgi:hypothetical protein
MTRITAPLIALFALACVPEQQDAADYSWVLPGDELLVSMPTGQRSAGDDSQYRADTEQVATDVNSLITDVLDTISAIAEFEPTLADDDKNKAVWGPWSDNGTDGMMFVKEFDDGHYEWALLGRPTGSGDEDWAALVAGRVEEGVTEDTGRGEFAFDVNVLAALDPNEDGTGVFAVHYEVRTDRTDVEAAFEGITGDNGELVDAGYRYGDDADGGFMDFAYETDTTGSGLAETVILRSRWMADGAGRGDAYVTGGDYGPLVYQASECWNVAGVVVFDENNAELSTSGDVADCAYAEAQWNEDGV